MALEVKPLHPVFAAELIGADLTQPPDAELVHTVKDAMDKYGVLVVRSASVNDDDHVRFSRAFGPLELPPRASSMPSATPTGRPRMRPELFYAGNLDSEGKVIPYEKRAIAHGAERFHTDSSFNGLPTMWSLLLGHAVPSEGGDTEFCDCRAAYDDLPQATKERIEELVCIHDFYRGRQLAGYTGEVTDDMRKRMPPVEHPLVRTMPYGRKALFIGGHVAGIVGWPQDEALKLLSELYDFATRDKYIYRHKWKPADLVIWDNRCTMHRATPLKGNYARDVRRTTISEYGPETSWAEALASSAA
jgi:alpha-ketoglutarate-dependent 2,4-dichlorophenoxyacetate dioxygenase